MRRLAVLMVEQCMSKLDDNIQVWPSYAIIFGVTVFRPSRMSPSQWIKYWEARLG